MKTKIKKLNFAEMKQIMAGSQSKCLNDNTCGTGCSQTSSNGNKYCDNCCWA